MVPARSAALIFALFGTAASAEASVDAKVSSLAGFRPQVVDDAVVTTASIIEAVSLRVSGVDTPIADDLKVMLSAWGALGPGLRTEPQVSGDVDLAFVEGRLFKKHVRLRIGRQAVTGGVARMSWIDGAAVDVAGPVGLSASFAVGVPVGPRFSRIASGEWQINTRIQLAPQPWMWNLGVSFVHQADKLGTARQEFGLDGRWSIANQLTLAGAAMFSIPDKRFSEIDVGPRWQPALNFELGAGYRRTAPDLLVPRTSIFSVFSDTSRDEVGGNVFWAPAGWLALYADARGLFIEKESGFDVTARATLRPNRRSRTQISFMGRWLRVPSNGYLEGRISASHQLGHGVGLSAEFDSFWFDQAINGQRASVSGAGSLTWAFASQWQIALSLQGASTPIYQSRIEGLARLVWMLPGTGVAQ